MTESDLRQHKGFVEMCTADVNFGLLLSFFEQNCPFIGKQIADPTSIVRNEGMVQGWFELIQRMRKIHISPKGPPPPTDGRLYPDSDKLNQENIQHNRPPKTAK